MKKIIPNLLLSTIITSMTCALVLPANAAVYGVFVPSAVKRITASDGVSYTVTISYDGTAGIPEGAGLAVSEITAEMQDYAEYAARTEETLGWQRGSASSIRVFDIRILDAEGKRVQITAPVDVAAGLPGRSMSGEGAADTRIVHFADGAAAGEIIQNVAADGDLISFEAEGLSVYAIAEGPGTAPLGWSTGAFFG